MSFTDDAKKVFDLAGTALRGIELIGNIARAKLDTNKGGDALLVIDTIAQMTDVIKAGFDGKIHEDDVKAHVDAQIASFEAGLAKIDADDQAAIDKKFPSG